MITYTCNPPYGNLGNNYFQCASMMSLAKKFGTGYMMPDWKYNNWLKNPIPTGPYVEPDLKINEASYNYTPGHFEMFENEFKTKTVGIGAWLQSEKYFDVDLVREAFEFQPEFKEAMRQRYAHIFTKPVIAISVRRGDFVNNANHYCLPITYYILALIKEFPNWRDCHLFFFSDDLPYCKVHFECLDNAFFAEDILPIEQLCLGSMCDHFLISNSTFSWWLAWLGEKPTSKIVRPNHVFAGKLLERNGNAPDYFPSRWTVFEHKDKKIDLRDCTFTIPVFHDHGDRKQNLDLSVCILQREVDTHISIGEQGSEAFGYMEQWCTYRKFDMNVFHRTRMLNQMIVAAETPIVVNWDADVFVPPMQLYLAAEAVRSGADAVYPYDGRFARVPRETWFKPMEKNLDVGIFGNTHFKGKNGSPLPTSSVGGAVFFNKESFIDGGMENEHMISYAPEDCERYDRFNMLGYKVERIKGSLYHLDHWCGENSRASLNPYFKKNHAEIDRIRLMTKEELRAYVDSWEWVASYTAGYYDEIMEDSITSRDEVFRILLAHGYKFSSVIDIGAGIGQWGQGIDRFGVETYKAVDYRIPKSKLLVPVENYAEYDLKSNKPFPFEGKYDLVICAEVCEHIEERFAPQIIKLLTSLGNTILFSSAIPFQGGRGHVNEQFQDYWAGLFEDQGFHPEVLEEIRWNEKIAIWYRQNLILYRKAAKRNGKVVPFVHPQMYLNVVSTLKNA